MIFLFFKKNKFDLEEPYPRVLVGNVPPQELVAYNCYKYSNKIARCYILRNICSVLQKQKQHEGYVLK